MAKFTDNLDLTPGVVVDATEIQLRGAPVSFNVIRDPAVDDAGGAVATPNYTRGRKYGDTGLFDGVRRDAQGLKYIVFSGLKAIIIAERVNGFAVRQATIELNNLIITRNTMYSNTAARVRPAFVVDGTNLHDCEYIVACLRAGFTEHPQADTTHRFRYNLFNDRPFVTSIEAMEAHV